MNVGRIEADFQRILAPADVQLNPKNTRSWDIEVFDPNFYGRVLKDGLKGAAEGYVEGEWDCERLDILMDKISKADLVESFTGDRTLALRLGAQALIRRVGNFFSGINPSFEVGRKHYDLPGILYEKMLGEKLIYTCAYWEEGATTLEQAQEAKMDLIGRKLKLEKGQRVLDIGGGAGALSAYMAEKYGVSVVNIGISEEQIRQANQKYPHLAVVNRKMDFRELVKKPDRPYDRIVSVGMFEHVGENPDDYKVFMEAVDKNLAPDGIVLLHTIGSHYPKPQTQTAWVKENIFPNSRIPAFSHIAEAMGSRFVVQDIQNIGRNYDPTLMAWNKNFEENWDKIKPHIEGDPERFRRMWRLYLLGCAGRFRADSLQVWQIVMTKKGKSEPYKSVR